MGTRRLEEMITDARAQAYSGDFSLTEGWDDNVVARLFNLALNQLYHAVTQISNPANVEETSIDVVAATQSYDIPLDVFMAIRLLDVRFQWGTATYDFVTLKQGDIQDRFDYPINIPDYYCIRDGKILLSPTPNVTKTGGLIINYQKRMRTVDVRRGLLASKTDTPVTITLSFAATSQKDANMKTNAESVLDKIDYICLVDRDGAPIVSQIPVNNYNTATKLVTAESTYVFPAAELTALDAAIAAGTAVYVVSGLYASSHSELDTQSEDYLIEYVISRLLRLQSNTGEMGDSREREKESLQALVNAYRRYRKTTYPVRWMRNLGNKSSNMGLRGVY